MYVLGIDPGLSATGYAVVDPGDPMRALAAGVIRTDPDAPTTARLAELFADLEGLIAEHEPGEAAIEQVFVNQNRRTATAVGRASGVAILAASRAGLAVHEYTPSAVKMAVVGHGAAPKSQVQAMVARRLGLAHPPRPADAADALAVAICHVQSAGLQRAIKAARR